MYLDPGFGTMIIQLLVAGLAVVGAVFFSMRSKIRAFFKKGKGAAADEEAAEEEPVEAESAEAAPVEEAAENTTGTAVEE